MAILSDYREQKLQKSSKDDAAQQFNAGGSKHSGQMIEGPPRKKANPRDIAKEVFESELNWERRKGCVHIKFSIKFSRNSYTCSFGSGWSCIL